MTTRYTRDPTRNASARTTHDPTSSPAFAQTLTATGIASAEALGSGAITGGSVAASPDTVQNTGGSNILRYVSFKPFKRGRLSIFAPVSGGYPQVLFAAGIASAEAFGRGRLRVRLIPPQALIARGIAAAPAFGRGHLKIQPSAAQLRDEDEMLFDLAA